MQLCKLQTLLIVQGIIWHLHSSKPQVPVGRQSGGAQDYKIWPNLLRDVMTFPTISNVEERRPDDAIVAENKSRAYPPLLSLFQVVRFCSWKTRNCAKRAPFSEEIGWRLPDLGLLCWPSCVHENRVAMASLPPMKPSLWLETSPKKRRNFRLSICLHLVLDASCGFLVSWCWTPLNGTNNV